MKSLALLLLLALLAPLAPPASAQSPVSELAAIDAFVEARWGETNSPGLAYAIVRDGALVHARGLGRASATLPATADTPFAIGSMSKSFTAMAVLQLVDARQVELDAPVRRYLPEFQLADPGASDRITVRQLLNQTSGIPTSAGFWRADPGAGDPLTLRVQALREVRPFAEPGTAYAYSNANFDVAGLLVQRVGGQPFDAFVAERILAPLGMARSGFHPAAGQASGHQDWLGLALPANPPANQAMWPAGGLFSSATDMGRYLLAQLDAGRGPKAILSPAGFAELHQGVGASGYAMGWDTEIMAGVPVVEHGGASPAFHSSMLIAPEQGVGVVVLSNINTSPLFAAPQTKAIAAGILALLLGQEPAIGGVAGLRTGLVVKYGLLALTLLGLVQLPRDLRRARQRLAAGTGFAQTVVTVVANLALGLFLLIWLPPLMGTPLWAMLNFNPDLASLLVIGAAGALLSAGLHAATLLQQGQAEHTGASDPDIAAPKAV